MVSKVKKNFRKEMKKFEKQRKKSGKKEPLSYIYQDEYPSQPGKMNRFLSCSFSFIVRIAMIVGFLSITGMADPFIKNLPRPTKVESISQQPSINLEINQTQILFDYLDHFEEYSNKAEEIIERYNNGKLEVIEVYALQKVLIDSLVFTKDVQNDFLVELNEVIVLYHNKLIDWLTVLTTPTQGELNNSILDLRGASQEVIDELQHLFEEMNISYEINLDGGINYERVSDDMK